ncbi:MAG: Ig-like domain-containing protein [Bacteroidales bacterium]
MKQHLHDILFSRYCTIVLLGFIISSCARIVPPQGGSKDISAPKFVSSQPKENSVNFKGNSIEIHFDEYIVLDNATTKLIISPPLKKKPTISSKLKSLYIKDIDSLVENTTYIFDFTDAIIDFTEGNRLSHFSFAISTGNNIDTFTYKNRVINAYTLKPEPSKYVALYRNDNPTYIQKNLPDYITKSDSMGDFYFRNIKEGKYMIIAFEDLNQNMIYDLASEGFAVAKIKVPYEQKKDDEQFTKFISPLLYNTAEDTIPKIVASKINNEYEIQIVTSIPTTDDFNIIFNTPSIDEKDFVIHKNENKDTITIYSIRNPIFDTIQVEVEQTEKFKERLDLTFNKRKKKNNEEGKTFKFSLMQDSISFFENLKIISPYTLPNINNTDVIANIIHDNDTISVKLLSDNNNPKILSCSLEWLQGVEYTLLIDSNQICDIRGCNNESMKQKFHIDSQDDYGSFTVTVSDSTDPNQNIILSLFDTENKQIGKDIIAKTDNTNNEFKNLKEGKYRLRVIIDTNNNNKWDKGNFHKNTIPEKVIFFDKTISIRKGWQTQEEWIL